VDFTCLLICIIKHSVKFESKTDSWFEIEVAGFTFESRLRRSLVEPIFFEFISHSSQTSDVIKLNVYTYVEYISCKL
jgi:hypothetical protein